MKFSAPGEQLCVRIPLIKLCLLDEDEIYLKELLTVDDGFCYSLTATRKINEEYNFIEIWSNNETENIDMSIFFTSEKNSYGITRSVWKDGKVFSPVFTEKENAQYVDLSVEEHINLKCNDHSFYECAGSKIMKSDFGNCSIICMPVTLPNVKYPICQNYENWFDDDNCEECDCNMKIINDIIKDIETNDECPRSCSITQYSITNEYVKEYSGDTSAYIVYKFASPSLMVNVFEEYILFDAIGMIGSVGGTLGLFIGFSFSNVITVVIKYVQGILIKRCSSRLKNNSISINLALSSQKNLFTKNTDYIDHRFSKIEMKLANIQQEQDKLVISVMKLAKKF